MNYNSPRRGKGGQANMLSLEASVAYHCLKRIIVHAVRTRLLNGVTCAGKCDG